MRLHELPRAEVQWRVLCKEAMMRWQADTRQVARHLESQAWKDRKSTEFGHVHTEKAEAEWRWEEGAEHQCALSPTPPLPLLCSEAPAPANFQANSSSALERTVWGQEAGEARCWHPPAPPVAASSLLPWPRHLHGAQVRACCTAPEQMWSHSCLLPAASLLGSDPARQPSAEGHLLPVSLQPQAGVASCHC